MSEKPFVCTFESRRSAEMQSLIEKFGGRPFVAPSMKEVPLDDNTVAISAIRKVIDGHVDAIVLLTGVGTDAMMSIAASIGLLDELHDKLSQMSVFVRGPKPAAALKQRGLTYSVKAPEPNTWQQLMDAIAQSEFSLSQQTVAVQEYGISNPDLIAALETTGATVIRIPVYRWTMPDDITPMKQAIEHCIRGDFDAVLFTSAQQIRHVLQVSETVQRRAQFEQALQASVVGSIGPTCSQALKDCGLEVRFEASPPKMGPFVRGILQMFQRPESTT